MHNTGRVHDTLGSVLAADSQEGCAILSLTYRMPQYSDTSRQTAQQTGAVD
jgi:hypothetical protein